MKKFLVIVLLMFVSTVSFAQNWSIRAGGCFSRLNIEDMQYTMDAHSSYQFGMTYDKAFKESSNFGYQFAVQFMDKGGRYDNAGSECNIKLRYIQLQGSICGYMTKRLRAYVGVFAALKYREENDVCPLKLYGSEALGSIDCGLSLSVSYDVLKKIYVYAGTDMGVVNISPNTINTYTRSANVGVGYRF